MIGGGREVERKSEKWRFRGTIISFTYTTKQELKSQQNRACPEKASYLPKETAPRRYFMKNVRNPVSGKSSHYWIMTESNSLAIIMSKALKPLQSSALYVLTLVLLFHF